MEPCYHPSGGKLKNIAFADEVFWSEIAAMKTMFIINPISGKGKQRKKQKAIERIKKAYSKAGFEFEIRLWDRQDKIDEFIEEAVTEGFDVVVAAGGDGTVNEIGHRLVDTGIALGIIPLGSGNGFARHLGYSLRPKKAISQLLTGNLVEIDTGEFGGIPFLNTAGIGIDADVAEDFSKTKTRGVPTYMRLASQAFFNFETFSCSLLVDGKREYKWDNLMFINISNGSQWGAGAKVAPLSQLTDGWMEAIVLEKSSLISVPRLIKLLFQGTLYRHPNIKMVRGKKFEITRLNAGNAHVDGEPIKLGPNIEAKVKEKSMKLLVPKNMELV